MEILHKFHNSLLSRVELQLELLYKNATPSLAEVKKMISDKLKVSEDVIVIKKIDNIFGSGRAIVSAYVYDNQETIAKFEPKPKVKKVKEETPAKQ